MLKRQLADGTEHPCHKCGNIFQPASIKVKRPSQKPGLPGTFTEGGMHYVWVHERCAPMRLKTHGSARKRR